MNLAVTGAVITKNINLNNADKTLIKKYASNNNESNNDK